MKNNQQVALLTGATGAIGNAIARKIAEKGYRVVLVARNESKVRKTVDEIINKTGNEHVEYEITDLSSKKEIKNLSEKIDYPVHILLNDASVTPRTREETDEGIEKQWATNVLGYFWMMKFFSDRLKQSAPSRIVNVASYWAGNLDLNDPEFKTRRYDNDTVYRQSKQAERMLSFAFADKYKEYNIAVNACHPGDVKSTLSSNLGYGGFESPDQGAETPAWLATDPVGQENTGKYFEHKQESDCRFCNDKEMVEKLYRLCDQY